MLWLPNRQVGSNAMGFVTADLPGISAPLIMTPDYIQKSLDVFPVEFLNFRLIHHTLLGKDILGELEIDRGNMQRQCEREIKGEAHLAPPRLHFLYG